MFKDRVDAGRRLGAALAARAGGWGDGGGGGRRGGGAVLVLGLPRGGVPVAAEVARALDAELDVFPVRKLGVPGHRELAFGAIAPGGVRVLNDDVVRDAGVSPAEVERVAAGEAAELERRLRLYRDGEAPSVAGRVVALVDDGLATGATMRAAVSAVRAGGPARLVVAVPVGAPETCRALAAEADEFVCLETPEQFYAVGSWYEDFRQTSDDEVRAALAGFRAELGR